MRRPLRLAAAGIALAAAPLALPAAPARAQPADPAARCAALAQAAWPGLEVTATNVVPAAPANTLRMNSVSPDTYPFALPGHCRVEGVVDRRLGAGGDEYGLRFALALPADWNGRLLYQGGGGWNGSLSPPYGFERSGNPALARGFAVVATDGGHRNTGNPLAFFADQQASLDFAFDAVPTVTRVGKALAAQFYGRAPHHTYAMGCSTGGREGMLAAQRSPLLFDGVIAGAPAMQPWNSQLAGWNAEVAFARIAPRDAQARPLPRQAFAAADERLLHAAVARQCDRLDGLADGFVHNIAACRFDPGMLQCRGAKADSCLSEGQVAALRTAFGGARDGRGELVTSGFPWDLGLLGESVGNAASVLPSSVPTQFGPWPEPFSVDRAIAQVRDHPLENLAETARWTNLSTFHGRGGKILFYHGAADPWFSINDTIDYVQRLAAANPGADFSRFYAVPGMSHCNGGGTEVFDLLTPLVEWVEQGQAPAAIPARSAGAAGFSRPLCPWPGYAHYTGGDPRAAASFACRAG